jgi:hypothetical protein
MRPDVEALVEDFNGKQSNTVWPEAMVNSRRVDEFLWKGSPDAPLVQRIGACIFGLVFILAGIGWFEVARTKGWIVFGALSIFWFLIGGRLFLNGLKRRRKSTPNGR